MTRIGRTPLMAVFFLALAAFGPSDIASAAEPATHWQLQVVARPSSFNSADTSDDYALVVNNNGGRASSGPIVVTDTLPTGIVTSGNPEVSAEGWICSTGIGLSEVTCSSESPVPAFTPAVGITLPVTVEAGVEGSPVNKLEVSGGGASQPAMLETPVPLAVPPPPFGPLGFEASALDLTGGLETQAAGHPGALTASLSFPSANVESPVEGSVAYPVEDIKQAVTDVPAGVVGNALAAPTCTLTELANVGRCPTASRVGTFTLLEPLGIHTELAIFNIVPEHGYPAEFGVYLPVLQRANLFYATVTGSGANTHIRITSSPQDLFVKVNGISLSFFGNPAALDESHESEIPFATNPANCNATGFTTTIHADSWQHPGAHNPDGSPDFSDPDWKGASYESPPVTGCNKLTFEPSLALHPDNPQADSPAGLNVDLHVPQSEGVENPGTPPLKDATVTLPKGLAVNPSSADGLAGCSAAQIAVTTNDPGACPDASQIGTVEVDSPVIGHPLAGKVFLGNPKLIKLYLEVNDPQTGIVVKLPGQAAITASGQLQARFTENPQFPFEDLKLNFKTGARATLTTPSTCGHYSTTTDFEPWSAPETPDATPTAGFDVTQGPGGSPCVSSEAQEPNKPSFEAGTVSPQAGAFSPFVLKLSRENGSQPIKGLDVGLPSGLTGRLAGVPYCPDTAIAAAERKSGSAEKASPSCPSASELGTVNVGAGSGTPFYVQGHAYLTGPYKGAPLSMAIITPAVAGPFDLGTVVVRAGLYVDPETAKITVRSDPIPTELAGIPLDLRSIAVNITRNRFTLNPTSCDPTQITATAIAAASQAPLASPFQVGGCKALGFAPKLSLRLKGDTKRGGTPALNATLTYPSKGAYANIAKASVALPHSEFLDNAHIQTVCTRVQLAQNACPKGSIYGHARAITPLLDKPLEGPVYLGTGYGHELPDLLADLNGQIHVILNGTIDSIHGGIRNRFEVVPDAPVTKFTLTMQGGKKGLLENSTNLCAKTNRATVRFTAQSGKVADSSPPVIAQGCKKAKKGKAKKKHHGAG